MKLQNLALSLSLLLCSASLVHAQDLSVGDGTEENQVTNTESMPDMPEASAADSGFDDQLNPLSLRSVSCATHKYHTAGCITCTGSGEVRIVIDCKAPQITDFKGTYTRFTGQFKQCGECNFGINSVSYQARQ